MATKLGTLTLDLVAKIGNFTQGMRQASSSAEREMQRASSSVNVMNGMLGKLAATAGAAFSINQIVNYADSYTGLQNRLKLVTASQAELNTAMNDTFTIAQKTASSWDSTAMVYQRFADNADRLGISLGKTAELTETVSKAISVSGGSAASAEAALMQFGQALASGVLRGEEFNSIAEQAPGLLKAIAKGMDVNIGALRAMAADGKITGDVLVDALGKAKPYIDDLFNKTDFTISQSFTKLSNEVTKFVGEFDAATGASKTFVEGITTLSENMEGVVNSMMVGAAFMAGTYIPAIYSTITAGYAKTKQLIDQTAIQYGAINAERAAAASALAQAQAQIVNTRSTLTALAAEKALEVQRLQAQINAAGRMATTTRMAQLRRIEAQATAELVAAETALAAARARSAAAGTASAGVGRAALGVLFGPVGLGVAVASVAAGYLLMKGNADKATASIDTQGQSVSDLIEKYQELNTLQRDNETRALAQQVEDLSLKYRVAASDLFAFMEGLPIADEKINTFKKLNSELSQGRISSNEYYEAVKEVNVLTDDQLAKVSKLIGAYSDNKKELKAAEQAQDALEKSMKKTTKEAKEQAAGVGELSEEIKKLLKVNSEESTKSNYLNELVKRNIDPKLAEMMYEARKASNIAGTSERLNAKVLNSVLDRWKADQGLNKTLEERAKIEERNKKLVEAQGNAMKVNALVASNAAKANYAALESAKGLPKGLLSAVNMTESPNSNTARSSAGARGAFQFMPKTAERFNVDVNSVNSSAKGAAEYLDKLLKMFEGNLENALRAYNWGEGNMQNYLKYGSGMKNGQKGYFADRPLPKETREYSGKVMSYMGGSSGVSFTEDYSFDDWLKEQEQFAIEREKREKEIAEKQKELALEVATYREKVNSELADKLEEIDKAGFDSAKTAELKAEYKKRAEIDIQVSEAAHSDKLAGYSDYLKSEEQLLNESFARRQRDLKLDLSLTAEQYTELSLALEKQRNKELQQAKWRALEARQAMADQIKSLASGSEDVFARASMAPQDYAKWSLENSRNNSQLGLQNDLGSVQRDIASSDAYSTDEERYQALLDAHEAYLSQKTALDIEYAQQVKDLETRQYENTIQMYGSLLSQVGSVWGDMTQMVKDSAGESSSAYKAMFVGQQALAIASGTVSAWLAYLQVLGDPSIPAPAKPIAAKATLGLGMAGVGMIAAQAIAGMAHDGIDNIPKEGTWLLDKGERVVDSRTNADLKGMIANQKNGGGNVEINVHVTDSGVTTQSNQSDQKQLGQMIGNAVRTVIRQEQRQGGLLAK
ncbi:MULTISPECIES: tape measure protein [Acinetobacter]|uniref:tape measure protein n=1 Tax=Acinetobacter TaxID=469 RepID=UPI0002CE0662|nr:MULTISPECIES: tape measure protein [Acinetobacter]ENX29122.1 hypothetical protein F890_02224 [Acinetobacter sp. CIP 64.7]